MTLLEPTTLAIVAATFVIAGMVKGVIGLGLPTVTLGLLTAAIDLTTAMALLLAPSFVTNLWQALVGGHLRKIMREHWPFLLAAFVTIPLGALALNTVRLEVLSALLGTLIALYAALSLLGLRFSILARQRTWSGPVLGATNGILTGMTGSFVVPGVPYLQALGLPRDMLVQAMGVLFTGSTLFLALALGTNNQISSSEAIVSAFGVLPAIGGMVIGQRIRRRLSETLFRRVFFVALLALGAYILVGAAIEVR